MMECDRTLTESELDALQGAGGDRDELWPLSISDFLDPGEAYVFEARAAALDSHTFPQIGD